jgi:hypothetical protein
MLVYWSSPYCRKWLYISCTPVILQRKYFAQALGFFESSSDENVCHKSNSFTLKALPIGIGIFLEQLCPPFQRNCAFVARVSSSLADVFGHCQARLLPRID